jgi:UDP-N-acetylmuramoylalanine--D-glutamate ligase
MIAEVIDVTPTVPHNVSNALAASSLALSAGANHEAIRAALKKFTLGRHRIEQVYESDGITWIDDSKATNPHAACASIMSALSVIWIAGGLAKGTSMNELVKKCAARLKAVILIGQDRELIAHAIALHAPSIEIVRVDQTSDAKSLMNDVVRTAIGIAQPGDTVLLAPACASMDQFDSYVQRGQFFAQAVKAQV